MAGIYFHHVEQQIFTNIQLHLQKMIEMKTTDEIKLGCTMVEYSGNKRLELVGWLKTSSNEMHKLGC